MKATSEAMPVAQDRVVDALRLPSSGRVFDLGTELAMDMPVGPIEWCGGFRLSQYLTPKALTNPDDPPVFDSSVELIQGCLHIGSHFDALAHIQSSGKVHGGEAIADVYGDFGWAANGIETVAPVLARGLLLDVPALLGVERLPDLFEVTVEHVQGCLERQRVAIGTGDTVLVRTGKMADYHGDGSAYFSSGPGVGVEAAIWMHEQGMAILGSDTSATEPFPFPDIGNTVHKAMLVERGVYLIEILSLDQLAAAGVHEFLFVCLPLKLRGATGSWVRPVAVA